MLSKSRKTGIAIWAVAFALSVFLLLIIPNHYTGSVYVTLIFDGAVFISTLVLWLNLFKNSKSASDVFYCSPAMTVSTGYITIQFVLCIVTGILADAMTIKLSLILNFVLAAIAWILIFSTLSSKNHARRVDTRQKNHHVEL